MDLNLPPILPNTNLPAAEAAASAPAQNTWPIESALHPSLIGLALSYLPGRALALARAVSSRFSPLINDTPYLSFKIQIVKARAITHPQARTKTLSSLALSQEKSGDRVGSKATFEEAIAVASAITSYYVRSRFLINIAIAQAKSGDIEGAKATFNEALAVASAITDPYIRCLSLRKIAIVQGRSGDIEGAKVTAALITNHELRKNALRDIETAERSHRQQ